MLVPDAAKQHPAPNPRDELELEIASKFDNPTESKSFVRYNALPEPRALYLVECRGSGGVYKHWMVPHIQELSLQQEVQLSMDRY